MEAKETRIHPVSHSSNETKPCISISSSLPSFSLTLSLSFSLTLSLFHSLSFSRILLSLNFHFHPQSVPPHMKHEFLRYFRKSTDSEEERKRERKKSTSKKKEIDSSPCQDSEESRRRVIPDTISLLSESSFLFLPLLNILSFSFSLSFFFLSLSFPFSI